MSFIQISKNVIVKGDVDTSPDLSGWWVTIPPQKKKIKHVPQNSVETNHGINSVISKRMIFL
jgi:hypothetical protein